MNTHKSVDEVVEEFDREYIVIKRPECNVLAFEVVDGGGNIHRLQEINPKDVLPFQTERQKREAEVRRAIKN